MSEEHVIAGLKANMKQANIQYEKKKLELQSTITAQAETIKGLEKLAQNALESAGIRGVALEKDEARIEKLEGMLRKERER